MHSNLSIAFIGGDLRQIQVITRFAQEGHKIQTFGLDYTDFPEGLSITQSHSLGECIHLADLVILPLPYSDSDHSIRSSFCDKKISASDVVRQMNGQQLLFAGRVDEQLFSLANLYNIHLVDYGRREELEIYNSIPTVEGAIAIAMAETPYTIHQSRCLVLGYGRIGKLLADTLHALGAQVTVAARKYSDLAWISAKGLAAVPFADLKESISDSQLIFNTVPATVLDFPVLSAMPDYGLIIDLASKPGGVDFETAKNLNKKVIWALSLPGKVAPETAGNIIKDTISNILQELGV